MSGSVRELERVIAQPDAPPVVELTDLLRYEYIGMFGEPDPNPEGGLERASGKRGAIVLLAESTGYPVALCGITLEPRPGTFPLEQDAILRRMFTRYEWRRHGLGKQLLASAEDQARRLGATRLKLETGVQMTAALHLYAEAGYTAVHPFGFYARTAGSVFLGKEL